MTNKPEERWTATLAFRWLDTGELLNTLQQCFTSNLGNVEWRDVPTVRKKESKR